MAKWFRGRSSRKGKRGAKLIKPRRPPVTVRLKVVSPATARVLSASTPVPTMQTFAGELILLLTRGSNADNNSKVVMVQTAISRVKTFLSYIEEQNRDFRGKRTYEALLWASTRPDMLELFVDMELVKTKGLTPSTVLNWLVDLKKAITWAVNYHRKTCGTAVPYAII